MSKMASDKGAIFERKVSTDLSLWLSRGERKDLFWRSSQSGGRATQALKSGDNLAAQAGDLVAVDELGMALSKNFVIECKHRNEMGFYNLVVKHKGPLYNFWYKLCEEANTFNKSPWLIFRENRKPILMGLNIRGLRTLCKGYPELELARFSMNNDAVTQEMFLVDYEQFLEIAEPTAFT